MTDQAPTFRNRYEREGHLLARACANYHAIEEAVDAAMAKLSDAKLEEIREEIAHKYEAIDPRLGAIIRKRNPRESNFVRAHVRQIFFPEASDAAH